MKTKVLISLIAGLVLLFAGVVVQMQAVEEQQMMTEDSGGDTIVPIAYKGHVDVYEIPAGTTQEMLVASKDNLLVDAGQNYIKQQIGNGSAQASSSAKYISLSNDATAPQAGWVNIPSEITANGLGRAAATYADNGTGAWNYTYTWTASGAQSAQLTGLNYGGTASDNTLFAALQLPSVSLQANDQLKVIWSISVS